jgi:hypothetical protein
MPSEREDWELERVYGHTIERPKGERRCQVKAKVQCVLQKHMTKDQAFLVAEEVVTELGL